jgi:hypothetical protein
MGLRTSKLFAALAASAALVLVAAAGAQARVVSVTGSTTFTPSAAASQFLSSHGVSVAPTGKATRENGSFVFPITAGFGNTRTYNGLLAHKGGLKFSKGSRSAVVRNFVAVRVRGAGAVLLAQIPALRGGCGHLRQGLKAFGLEKARNHPKATRKLVRAVRSYCSGGKVIMLARLTNLQKQPDYNGALLSADLKLSGQAARLLNRLAGRHAVSAGAPLGTAESRVLLD